MKKKTILRIVICIFIILIILLGGLLILDKKGFIENIENIKSKKIEEKGITKIDITDLEDNSNIDHEHLFKTMYDENKHWEECTVCRQKNNEKIHSYNVVWKLGYESCREDNYATNICSCGYSYIWHKPCVWNGKYTCNTYDHGLLCTVCNVCIYNKYYWKTYGNGELYDGISTGRTRCTLSSGEEITCLNGGTCAVCKKYWTRGAHKPECNVKTGKIYCIHCKTEYGSVTETITYDENIPKTYTFITRFNLNNGATFNSLRNMDNENNYYQIAKQEVVEGYSGGTDITVKGIVKFNSNIKLIGFAYQHFWFNINGVKSWAYTTISQTLPDTIPPEILNIKMENNNSELTEWSRTKPIIISGTENYLDNVTVKILDEKENIVFEGEATVKNNSFSISCTPELEVNANGKKFKAVVTDSCGNSTEQEFEIAKVDAIPPTATSSDDITGEWSKSRKFTFKSIDYGIGEVKVAFNDVADLSLANFDGTEYSRDYEFYGDVYTPKQLSVLYKDGLGNTSIQKITIDKLDNTVPTIESASIHNNILTVNAHDRHERLGEGSGIVKYRYIVSGEKLSNPDISSGIEVNVGERIVIDDIYKIKYIYVVAEDLVGNISEVYELKVPELILTSSVNLNTADGKGEIILDWSSYDVSDKYFVIYRKKDNQMDWEEIVPLTQKLTGSTYTDKLGNDEVKSNVPTININGDAINNNINVTVSSTDNGTNYKYYIEAYDNIGTLLSKSN